MRTVLRARMFRHGFINKFFAQCFRVRLACPRASSIVQPGEEEGDANTELNYEGILILPKVSHWPCFRKDLTRLDFRESPGFRLSRIVFEAWALLALMTSYTSSTIDDQQERHYIGTLLYDDDPFGQPANTQFGLCLFKLFLLS